MITILGPTATGKTRLAAELAHRIGGEVISADSRQVYRGMDIGTGKDLQDYVVDGNVVPCHLTDIAEPGEEYNLFRFQRDFHQARQAILDRGKAPVLCGGSGMYLESVLLAYDLIRVPENNTLRKQLENLSRTELENILASVKKLHNTTDTTNRKRLIRAIEIAKYYQENPGKSNNHFDPVASDVFGVFFEREELRRRITQRLKRRMEEGMIEEVKVLLKNGVNHGRLLFFGLEYRHVTLYLNDELTYDEMFTKLNTAIHQFAKRQMTWFRRMEKKGIQIRWIDGKLSLSEKLGYILKHSDRDL